MAEIKCQFGYPNSSCDEPVIAKVPFPGPPDNEVTRWEYICKYHNDALNFKRVVYISPLWLAVKKVVNEQES